MKTFQTLILILPMSFFNAVATSTSSTAQDVSGSPTVGGGTDISGSSTVGGVTAISGSTTRRSDTTKFDENVHTTPKPTTKKNATQNLTIPTTKKSHLIKHVEQKPQKPVLSTDLVFSSSLYGKKIPGGQILKIKRANYCYFCDGNCTVPMAIENCEQIMLLRRNRTGCLSVTYPDGMRYKRCAYETHARALCRKTCKFVDCYFCRDSYCNLKDGATGLRFKPLLVFSLALVVCLI